MLQHLDEWIRRRLRSAVWKQWKRGPVLAATAGSAHGP
ncbi:MAG TPA: group II intron maturase-specific domain-containing protein [Candidatus Methylomirabilis sp.]